jgi:hypothetical protein
MMLRTLVAALATGPVAVAQFAPVLPFPRTLDLVLVDSTLDGIWRLSDLNLDGDYNDAGEVVAIYDDVAGTVQWTSPTAIVAAEDGTIYAADTAFDRILRHRDLNGDGDMLDAGEHGIFFDPSNAGGLLIATPQGLTVDAIGRVFVAVANAGSPAVGSETRTSTATPTTPARQSSGTSCRTAPRRSATRFRPRWRSVPTWPSTTPRMRAPSAGRTPRVCGGCST